ncbi:MAG: NrfD/PsrC family molybdoenzyme membrane anchor subunit, partial [Chloroflexota bacterium]
MPVEWVTFDCYGTLIDWERGIADALLPLLPRGADRRAVVERYIEIEKEVEGGEYVTYRDVLDRSGRRLLAERGRPLPDGAPSPLPGSLPSWPPFPEVPAALREPAIAGNKTPADVTREICAVLDRKPSGLWWAGLLFALSLLLAGAGAVAYQVQTGIGTWGLNRTVGWAFDITNFVFWIGIGHAGTLISAILFLFRQRWRTSVNRSAEAMTIFAVTCAGLFPVIHMGRPWLAYWIFPYPNFRGPLWINFRSPLAWDAFAIGTYFTISLLFWYLGMLPDLATVRDRAKPGLKKALTGFLSLSWNGSVRTWQRYETVYLLLAGLATPLVISVHTIVSWDFATAVIPGFIGRAADGSIT